MPVRESFTQLVFLPGERALAWDRGYRCSGTLASLQRPVAVDQGALWRTHALVRDIDVSGVVDSHGGLLDRVIFTDGELYRQELRRLFAPSWLFLAHADQFHRPGEFFPTYMGEDPVIV